MNVNISVKDVSQSHRCKSAWSIKEALVVGDGSARVRMGVAAARDASCFSIANVARRYLRIFSI